MATITPVTSGILLTLVEKGTISRIQAKEVLKEVVATGKDPETIIKEKGLAQISDTGAWRPWPRRSSTPIPRRRPTTGAARPRSWAFLWAN